MPRAYWSGQIRLALVSIPVQIVPATRSSAQISFHQIHKPSGKRIRYEKVVPGLGPVENEDIVKGYEVEKGKYVLLSDDEIDKVKVEAKKSIELVQFVDRDEIPPVYFERPFFVLPDEESDQEAYIVLRDALERSKKIGLGQLVIRGKGSIVGLQAYEGGILLETMRYADELQNAEKAFSVVEDTKPPADLVELAEELIERKAGKFKPEAFKDTYTIAVRELIDAKLEKRPPREIEEPQRGAKVIDLMEALKRSVRGGEGERAPERRKRARTKTARRGAKRRAA